MKKLVLGVVFCVGLTNSFPASATSADLSAIKKILATQRIKSDGPLTPPTRSARLQIILSKVFNKKQGDGSFKKEYEQICSIEAPIDVYEVPRGTSVTPDLSHPMKCQTNLAIGPSTIQVWGLIEILRGLDNPFGNGTTVDWKAFIGYFEVKNALGTFSRSGSDIISISEDPKQKTSVQLSGSDGLSDSSGQQIDEFIQVTARFED